MSNSFFLSFFCYIYIYITGVTRDSILGLVRKWKESPASSPLSKLGIANIVVSERKITMPEVQQAANNGVVGTFVKCHSIIIMCSS